MVACWLKQGVLVETFIPKHLCLNVNFLTLNWIVSSANTAVQSGLTDNTVGTPVATSQTLPKPTLQVLYVTHHMETLTLCKNPARGKEGGDTWEKRLSEIDWTDGRRIEESDRGRQMLSELRL